MGLDSTTRSAPILRNRSGEALRTDSPANWRYALYGVGLMERSNSNVCRGSMDWSTVAMLVRHTS